MVLAGWTTISPSEDTRTVFVSSRDGNDSNDGATRDTPLKTIAAGVAKLRHGFPDHLLLRKGDSWSEPLGQWKKSGRSPTEPMVVSTYGMSLSRAHLFTASTGGVWTHGGGC